MILQAASISENVLKAPPKNNENNIYANYLLNSVVLHVGYEKYSLTVTFGN